jgi:SAM-dependent methyltransferase
MSQTSTGQISAEAAEIYEAFYLPALFQEWTPRMADAARIGPVQRVLDVACGTGVLARALAPLVGAPGSVAGLDINEGMLAVARRKAPDIEWRHGRAESLPFDGASFDAVLCQFGLMFFTDRHAALREMVRVLRPGGRLVVAVWASFADTPGYAALVALLRRLFGAETAQGLSAPYVLGDPSHLRALLVEAGLPTVEVTTHQGTARFPSIESWVYTDVKGWTIAHMIDEAGYRWLLDEAQRELRPFATGDGRVCFSAPGHIAAATKPG